MSRRTPQGDVELLAYPPNGSAPRSLGWLRVHGDDLIPIPGVSLSPTGTRLRFTMRSDHRTTWAIEGFLATAKPAGRYGRDRSTGARISSRTCSSCPRATTDSSWRLSRKSS